jgi:hypothetical protein
VTLIIVKNWSRTMFGRRLARKWKSLVVVVAAAVVVSSNIRAEIALATPVWEKEENAH